MLSGGRWPTDFTRCGAQRFRRRSCEVQDGRRDTGADARGASRPVGAARRDSAGRDQSYGGVRPIRAGVVLCGKPIEKPDADVPAGAATALSQEIHEIMAKVKTPERADTHCGPDQAVNPPRPHSCARYPSDGDFASRSGRIIASVSWSNETVRPNEISAWWG